MFVHSSGAVCRPQSEARGAGEGSEGATRGHAVSERPLAAVAEQIAYLRGQRLDDTDLERGGMRLALVPVDAALEGRLWDLDDLLVLSECRLRPSQIATRVRDVTRRQAADLFRARPSRVGLRWSTDHRVCRPASGDCRPDR